jgi:hypothetical protein
VAKFYYAKALELKRPIPNAKERLSITDQLLRSSIFQCQRNVNSTMPFSKGNEAFWRKKLFIGTFFSIEKHYQPETREHCSKCKNFSKAKKALQGDNKSCR